MSSDPRADIERWSQYTFFRDQEELRDWCEFEYSGQVFISHCSKDAGWCEQYIVPVVHRVCEGKAYFFLSYASSVDQQRLHQQLVEYAFAYCKTIIIVISNHSASSHWVSYEARWGIEQQHPIILCQKDDTDTAVLRAEFGEARRQMHSHLPIELIDFRQDPELAEKHLAALLNSPAYKPELSPLQAAPFGAWGQGGFLTAFRAWRSNNKRF